MKIEFLDGYMIRNWRDEDASSLTKYANNKKIEENLRDGFPHPYTISDAKAFIEKARKGFPVTVFAIANHEEAIGSIGLMPGKDVHRFTAEMGYWLAEPFWGKGIMSLAVRVFSECAFEKFELVRIHADPFTKNPASSRVLEKAGFVLEGIMKASAFKDGVFCDQSLWAKIVT